jgi:hypothetical protein
MVRITKDSILCIEEDEGGAELSMNILESETGLVSYLDQFVAIDEGVSVGQLISILAEAKQEIDYVFDSALNGQGIEVYLAELTETSTSDGSLKFTEIAHDAELLADGVISEIKYFRGVGIDDETGRLTEYDVQMLPINHYKDLPIMLNHNYVVKRVETGGELILLKAKKGFTLFEVVYALLYEISFHGTPAERKELLDQILAVYEEALAPEAEMLALPQAASAGKDIELTRLNADMERALIDENYEAAASLRDRIKEINGDR